MAYDADEIEEKFDKFVEFIEQYLNEPINDLASLKPQLLDIFKTHHPIKLADVKHGLSKTLEENSQLIIHHFKNDRSLVREYFKAEDGTWKCCECTRAGAASKTDDDNSDMHVKSSECSNDVDVLLVERGIIFTKNDHYCEPRLLSYMYRIQKYYKEKKMSVAITLQKKTLGTEDAPFIPVKQKRVVVGKKKVEEADALQKEVLGSEDLNVVSSKQKGSTAKRGTKASSAKVEKDITAEVKSRLAQQTHDGNEENSSIVDENCIEIYEKLSPEESFTKIIENLQEYTNESKEAVMANKSKILSALKIRCPIKSADLQYGLSGSLRNDKRLIVFEWDDRRKVREYSKRLDRDDQWECRECYRECRYKLRDSYSYVHFIHGVAFAPIHHNCPPRDYERVMQYQKYLEEGNLLRARGMARTTNFTFDGTSLTNIINSLNPPPPSSSIPRVTTISNNNEKKSKTLINLKRKMVSDDEDDCICLDEISPVLKKSKLNKSTLDDTATDENDPGLLDEKLSVRNKSKLKRSKQHVDEEVDSIHIKPAPSASTVTPSICHFEKPSTSKLQEICDKLNIEYRNKAAKFWDKIEIDQIDTESKPTKTHCFGTDNFYQILSIFFTGKSKQHEQIKAAIIDAFRGKMVSSGEVSTKKFNKHYLDTVTGEHFSFIAKYLSCRILIFDGENGIQKYGKWKSTTSIRLTLVVALKDGYYSIVLKL